MIRPLRFASALILVQFWSSGCADTSPLHYVPHSRDGGAADAAVVSACNHCIIDNGAPCQREYDACIADRKCHGLAECALAAGCFTVPTLQQRIACAEPCLADAGILAGGDPSLALALNLNVCTLGACKKPCSGAGAGSDQ